MLIPGNSDTPNLDDRIAARRLLVRLGLGLKRLEVLCEVPQVLHDPAELRISLLPLFSLLFKLLANIEDRLRAVVCLGLGQIGLDAHPRHGLVGILLIESQVHEGVDELACLLSDDLADLLQMTNDLVRLGGRDPRHPSQCSLHLVHNLLRRPRSQKRRLRRAVSA